MTQDCLEIDQIFLEQARSLMGGGEVLPSIEDLAKKLHKAAETKTPLRVKLGLDPTRPDLHLGHSVVLKKLRAFQDLGHQAVLIIGDATAMIGDPSGRNQTRPPLTPEEIESNAQTYLEQAGKIIDVRKAEIVKNNDWLGSFNLGDFLRLASKATVAQLLARDDFAKRYADNKPISLHELFYPLMQGQDSVEVKADIELGGTDQRFNNLMGRELQTAEGTEPQLVILFPLLEGTDGKVKMSKSYPEHCINLTDDPADMFGKLMSIPDEMIGRYEILLTPMTPEQIEEQHKAMTIPPEQGGLHPRDVKVTLAKWIVSQYHDMDAADEAEAAFNSQFRDKAIPDDIPELKLEAGKDYGVIDLVVDNDMAPSKGEAKRLIQGGGVKLDGEKVEAIDHQLSGDVGNAIVLQVGKRKFIKLIF